MEALNFTNDSEPTLLYASCAERNACVELKEGGSEIIVTETNKAEYIQRLVEYRLVDAIKPQIAAFQNGLRVFVESSDHTHSQWGEDLWEKTCQCLTAEDMGLLVCGMDEIDFDDWKASTEYSGGFNARSPTVRWFWSVVRRMTNWERRALLRFCTGSARPPAAGFAHLMGYSGQQQRFRLQRVEGGSERLPTAATCFNTLRLPDNYTGKVQLLERLQRAMHEGGGFDEGAVAV